MIKTDTNYTPFNLICIGIGHRPSEFTMQSTCYVLKLVSQIGKDGGMNGYFQDDRLPDIIMKVTRDVG